MTLAFIVYLLGMITPLKVALGVIALLTLIVYGICLSENHERRSSGWYQDRERYPILKTKVWIATAISSLAFFLLIPSEKTAYIMVGAYATQEIATTVAATEEAKNIGNNILKIIDDKVQEFANNDKEKK